LAYTTLGRLHL